jgi:hypothetical protein
MSRIGKASRPQLLCVLADNSSSMAEKAKAASGVQTARCYDRKVAACLKLTRAKL